MDPVVGELLESEGDAFDRVDQVDYSFGGPVENPPVMQVDDLSIPTPHAS